MDVKDAVKRAKSYVAELFAEEGLTNLGLEEIEHDDQAGTWNVTLGFSRPWNTARNALTALTGDAAARRTYRIVRVRDTDGEVLSVKRRDVQE
jgi:uncharacterized protein YdeI (YjbR/CyaY-like superfamily)